MKKEEVFVVIDTEKKAKKVAVLLHMFRQYESGYHTLRKCLSEQACLCYDVKCDYWYWNYYDDAIDFRKEVSVSELKQILAMHHLKKCDVVIVGDESTIRNKWILELTGKDLKWFQHTNSYWLNGNVNDFNPEVAIVDAKFIRYATEEEKQLLNPGAKEDEKHTGSFESLRKCDTVDFPNDFKKVENPIKDLKVGNWYKFGTMGLCCFQGYKKEHYGFDGYGHWCSSLGHMENQGQATQEEVAERFFKECHKRYPNKIGFKFNHSTNEITTGSEIVFKNGTWLEAKKIEIDPLKELKEAHKKGFEIEYKSSSGQWKTSSNPAWRKTGNYRIRPVKIGDWFFATHEQTNVKYYYQINKTNINDVRGNHVRILNQMVIDILNNGKYTV